MEKPEWFDWANDEKKTGEWIRTNNPEWFAQICQILFDCDPMMMTLVQEPAGYAPEVGSILRSLPQCMSVDDVQQLIFNVFTQWFTPEFAGGRSQYAEVAAAIWENWKQQNTGE